MKILLIGERNSGKSTFLYNLFKISDCGGIICLPVFKNGKKIGTDAINLLNKEKEIFCRLKKFANFDGIEMGRYIISYRGIEFCKKALKEAKERDLIIIDEFGFLEINGEGIYEEAKEIIESNKNVIVVLRKGIEKEFIK